MSYPHPIYGWAFQLFQRFSDDFYLASTSHLGGDKDAEKCWQGTIGSLAFTVKESTTGDYFMASKKYFFNVLARVIEKELRLIEGGLPVRVLPGRLKLVA